MTSPCDHARAAQSSPLHRARKYHALDQAQSTSVAAIFINDLAPTLAQFTPLLPDFGNRPVAPQRLFRTLIISMPTPPALISACALLATTVAPADELSRWRDQASRVTIIRDTWGIPHIYGKSDADAVFGLLYAQAEDDFPRIELNYINALGRLAEVEGDAQLYRDLRMKLFIDPDELRTTYAASPLWLQRLMNAFADGLNFYLHTHPAKPPRLIARFEPWMALAFTEGSIGGDIESISLRELDKFYGQQLSPPPAVPAEPPVPREGQGSNGFAIGPALTASGHALLLINPHTSFYFRPEVHVVSEEGLNAYGAVTWGQFFVYQGFNDRSGWMHTSDGGDAIDEYAESINARGSALHYRYGAGERPVVTKRISLPYKDGTKLRETSLTAYFTHHGPIIREANDKWIAVKLMHDPVKALTQSFLRTKARHYADFYRIMELRTNTSNNTVYADADGTIAYFHGNFIPIRPPGFDWRQPLDGSNPATEWRGLHPVDEIIQLRNPPTGWIQNTNNWPFSAAGVASPRREDYPDYMWTNPENARGLNAVRVLSEKSGFTLDRLITAAYDPTLVAFEQLLPPLLAAFDALATTNPRRARLAEPVAALRTWDHRATIDSIPAALAILWAHELGGPLLATAKAGKFVVVDYLVRTTTAAQKIEALEQVLSRLTRDFGTWTIPWGEINRFQRLGGETNAPFDDEQPSLPVAFASGDWGSLAAFGVAGPPQKTKRIYGNRGNSFVAVVEFGPKLKAKSILAGGMSGDPSSPHFNDQAKLYAQGKLKDVWFYREDLDQNIERTYRPGD